MSRRLASLSCSNTPFLLSPHSIRRPGWKLLINTRLAGLGKADLYPYHHLTGVCESSGQRSQHSLAKARQRRFILYRISTISSMYSLLALADHLLASYLSGSTRATFPWSQSPLSACGRVRTECRGLVYRGTERAEGRKGKRSIKSRVFLFEKAPW